MPGSSAGGARAEVTHRTQATQRRGQSHHEGPSNDSHTPPPPPNPIHAGPAPSAETAVAGYGIGRAHNARRGKGRRHGRRGARTARSKAKTEQGERTMPKPRCDVPAVAGRRDVVGCRMPGSSAGGRGTRRGHTSHTSDTTKRAKSPRRAIARSTSPPPLSPSHAGAAPSAETAAVLATEPGGHTTHGEEREDGKPLPRQHPTNHLTALHPVRCVCVRRGRGAGKKTANWRLCSSTVRVWVGGGG